MEKKRIKIDEKKCKGCGLCVSACKESAIALKDGKAVLLHEDYCDGLGNCLPVCPTGAISFGQAISQLKQWPIQIKLVPVNAPYFKNAKLLVSADCSAYVYGDFHNEFIKNRITLIGCPKLDDEDYSEKLTAIFMQNDIKSVTVTRMEVPCCSGIENAVKTAIKDCGKMIPWQVVTISTEGELLD